MKNRFKVLKKGPLLVSLALISALGSFANGQTNIPACEPNTPCLTGAFRGEAKIANERTQIDLMLRPIVGRAGSYLGILFQYKPGWLFGSKAFYRAELYLVDPLKSSTYEMTPINVTKDGSIGVNNADPSLVMTFYGFERGQPKLTIVSANSTNQEGFQNAIQFDGTCGRSSFNWGQFESGAFKVWDGNGDTVLRLAQKDAEFQAGATLMMSGLNGQYLFEERQPGLFAIRTESVYSTGAVAAKYPSKIGFFFEYDGETHLALVEPGDGKNIVVLDSK